MLATLDPASLQAEVDQARANLLRLQAQYQQAKVAVEDATVKLGRAEKLAGDQLIAQADLDAARVARDGAQAALKSADAQVVQARASLAQSQVTLTHTIIRSPTNGIVLARNVEIGQTVTASLSTPTLFVIARDLATMQVSASVDESDIGRVAEGQRVTFSTDAYGTQVFEGKVTEVRLQPVVTQNVVTYTTIISVPNPELKLKPGMTADVHIETARADDTLRVPTAAIRFRPDEEVFAVARAGDAGERAKRQAGKAGGSAGQAGRASGSQARPRRSGPGTAGTPGSRAMLWKVVDGKLQPIRVTIGVSRRRASGSRLPTGSRPAPTIATGVRTGRHTVRRRRTDDVAARAVNSRRRRGGRALTRNPKSVVRQSESVVR